MAGDDMVFAEINGTLKCEGPASFIFKDCEGNDVVVPFSQIGIITHSRNGDMTIEQLKALKITREIQQIDSVEIPRWLANKLDLTVVE